MGRYEPRDHFFHRAKREGYAARSVYKLEEIDRKHRLLARGARVLDLGAAPGSWTQYASDAVGPKGVVVAVDRAPMKIPARPNVRVLQADVFAVDADALRALAGGAFAVVLSDMAPATTGDRFVDQQRSADLGARALEVAGAVLRPGGGFVVKALEGESTKELVAAVRAGFAAAKMVRPQSTRKGSTDVFVIGIGRKET